MMHNPGTLLIPKKSYCGDRARLIVAQSDGGYHWKYLGEQEVKDSAVTTSIDPRFEMGAWDVIETGNADTIERQAIAMQRLTIDNQGLREQLGKLEQKLRMLGQ